MAEKILTLDEIRRTTPRYRGKPENFRSKKVGQARQPPKSTPPKEKRGPKTNILV
jgi:hypothetical protein